MNMGAQVGGALTASLTPWIADHFGWTASFLVAAVLCALGALAWLVVDPEQVLSTFDTSNSDSVQDLSSITFRSPTSS
jgi:ACS family glucarate transporter-like MFS transporter